MQFNEGKYVGDPINAVRIFNEKVVDELIVLDIDATAKNREPNYEMIGNLATECRMPLCYGGGVQTAEQVEKIIGLGVEKVAMSSAAVFDPNLVAQSAQRVGNQSVVVVMDVKKSGLFRRHEVFTHNGTKGTGIGPGDFAARVQDLGAGEVVLNSIERDGKMNAYDLDLVAQVRDRLSIPMTVLGGAGSLDDISELIERFGNIGAAAGSLFVFKGKYRAVLINYPSQEEKLSLFRCGT